MSTNLGGSLDRDAPVLLKMSREVNRDLKAQLDVANEAIRLATEELYVEKERYDSNSDEGPWYQEAKDNEWWMSLPGVVGAHADSEHVLANNPAIGPLHPDHESETGLVASAEATVKPVDAINPGHYKAGALECIDVIEQLGHGAGFCVGNAIKYLWRAGKKGAALQDLQKARWYIDRAIRQAEAGS